MGNGTQVIVKVQRPLEGYMGDLLVYDEAKELVYFIPCASEVGKWLLKMMGDDLKMYLGAKPTVDGDYAFDYSGRAKAQDW
jgi:hypothetical protein